MKIYVTNYTKSGNRFKKRRQPSPSSDRDVSENGDVSVFGDVLDLGPNLSKTKNAFVLTSQSISRLLLEMSA